MTVDKIYSAGAATLPSLEMEEYSSEYIYSQMQSETCNRFSDALYGHWARKLWFRMNISIW